MLLQWLLSALIVRKVTVVEKDRSCVNTYNGSMLLVQRCEAGQSKEDRTEYSVDTARL